MSHTKASDWVEFISDTPYNPLINTLFVPHCFILVYDQALCALHELRFIRNPLGNVTYSVSFVPVGV